MTFSISSKFVLFMNSATLLLLFKSILLCSAINPPGCPFAKKDVLPLHVQDLGDLCQPVKERKPCVADNYLYTYDGSCNNAFFPNWGLAGMPFIRLAEANFSDGFCSLRRGSKEKPLPSARKIRTTLFSEKESRSYGFNIMYYAFAQWVSHDASQMLEAALLPGTESRKKCCKGHGPADDVDPGFCLPTEIPGDDPFFSKYNITCLDLTRSVNTNMLGCKVSPCLPINYQTPFVDLSMLYGASDETVNRLRSFKNGELKYGDVQETIEESIPGSMQGKEFCPMGGLERGDGKPCMISGDVRANQNPELTVLEIIFTRAHNLVAEALRELHPRWDDEKTFQEARRVLIALYQHITYAEHVPALIGYQSASNYASIPLRVNYNKIYNQRINVQTSTEYGFAAGRAHHSMIRGSVNYLDSNGREASYNLRNKQFNQRFFYSKNVPSNLLSVYLTQKANVQGKHHTEEMTNFLLAAPGAEWGMDLIAIDINRGRDVGLPTYNKMRAACGLCKLTSFEEFADEVSEPADIPKLKRLYSSIDDVDLYVGGLLENPIVGSTVGPTFTCIIAENFYRWKFADRLFYEFPTSKFNFDQLQEIRKATFAWLVCRTTPQLVYIPKNPFLVPSKQNPLIHCDDLDDVDFSVFGEIGDTEEDEL